MSALFRTWAISFAIIISGLFVWLAFSPDLLFAKNITSYKDLITNSAPGTASNHTLSFTLGTNISPGSYIEITPPAGFEILGTSTFSGARNVELYVDDVLRDSATTSSPTEDLVEITDGSPGMIKYTLNSTTGISAGSRLQLKIGNHTSKSQSISYEYSTSTGTTTIPGDIKAIINSSDVGSKQMKVEIYDGGLIANANFYVAIIDSVGVGPVDSTEEIPPERFNGSPTSTITGTSLNVEIFLETNEFAVCKYDTVANINYSAMTHTFSNTGLIYHTVIVPVVPNSTQSFYVRCIDDEGNFNIDDYLIEFAVSDIPTGTSNTDGTVSGDGSGSGNNGTGSGGGAGGTSGQAGGVAPDNGGSSGSGGSGGGGGGGSGGDSGSGAGGGFESTDAPYRSGDGRVVITGYAFPNSDVTALVDGKTSVTGRSGSQGAYSLTIDLIARGVYTFGVYSTDPKKVKSSTFSTSFTVSGARTSTLSNINISPSFAVTPDPVDPGQSLTINGYAIPNSVITLENIKDGTKISPKVLTATSNASGVWSTILDTNGLSVGTYKLRAKSEQASSTENIKTNFSNYLLYGVGQTATKPRSADLNRDSKVNLVDFSILLFWWNTNGGTSDPSADINSDGKVSLTDFSILLFNWTG